MGVATEEFQPSQTEVGTIGFRNASESLIDCDPGLNVMNTPMACTLSASQGQSLLRRGALTLRMDDENGLGVVEPPCCGPWADPCGGR